VEQHTHGRGTYTYIDPCTLNAYYEGADIWSLSVLGFELMTSRLPFGPIQDYRQILAYEEKRNNGVFRFSATEEDRLSPTAIEFCRQTLIPNMRNAPNYQENQPRRLTFRQFMAHQFFHGQAQFHELENQIK